MQDKEKIIEALTVILGRDLSVLDQFSEGDLERLLLEINRVVNPILDRAEKIVAAVGAPIPLVAPEEWSERLAGRKENPAQFTQRVYGRWIGQGLTRGDILRVDPKLYAALDQYKYRRGLPFDLPDRTDVLDKELELAGLMGMDVPPSTKRLMSETESTTPPQIPLVAPEEWSNRPKRLSESPEQFIARVYKEWIGNGLTRGDILHLDRPLYMAWAKSISRNPTSYIPTGLEVTQRQTKNLSEGEKKNVARLGSAARTRIKKFGKIAPLKQQK